MGEQFREIGMRIRDARKKKKLTQAALADMVGIAHSHMSDIERGETKLGVDILIRISETLEVSTDWILRADIPNVSALYGGDIAELLSDCTSSEGQMYLRILRETKQAVRDHESKEG